MLTSMPKQLVVARGSRSRSTRLLVVALVALLSLTLAACGGGDEKKASAKPDSQPIEGGAKLAALWPLTGQPVEGSTPNRPVLVTKIDNTHSSQPQLGLWPSRPRHGGKPNLSTQLQAQDTSDQSGAQLRR